MGQGAWSQLVPAAPLPVQPLTFSMTLISVGPVCCGDPAVWLEERQRRSSGALHYMPFRQTPTTSAHLSLCLLLSIFTPFSIKTHDLNTQATLCTARCDTFASILSFPALENKKLATCHLSISIFFFFFLALSSAPLYS